MLTWGWPNLTRGQGLHLGGAEVADEAQRQEAGEFSGKLGEASSFSLLRPSTD